MRRISIPGATGSIRQNTVDLIRRDLGAFHVVALTADGTSYDLHKMRERCRRKLPSPRMMSVLTI